MIDSAVPESVELIDPADVYVPINTRQVGDLIGKMLTLIDALGLPTGQGKAVKDIARQHVHGWFGDATDNARTSYRGCIAPIHMLRNANGTERGTMWTAEGEHTLSFDDGIIGVIGQTVDPSADHG